MPTLFFPERETLRLVLASGAVASPVTHAAAETGWDERGRLWLTTDAALPRETLTSLQRFGVSVVGSSPVSATENISCWQQLVPLERVSETHETLRSTVLFDVPGGQFSSFVGECDRCGVKSYSYRWLDDPALADGSERILVKVESPPVFTLLRAMDSTEIHAYVEQARSVWVAAGWQHSFANQIRPPEGKLLFLDSPRVWSWRDGRPFQEARLSAESVHSPENASNKKGGTSSPGIDKIAVSVRLRPVDDTASAELWIIREAVFQWLERFLRTTDEHLLNRFTCAVVQSDGNPILVLRIRGKGPAPILVEAPLGYRPLLKLSNLFAPSSHTLAPLPRRETIRQILCADPTRLTWLNPQELGAFSIESVAISEFRPLVELVEYRTKAKTRKLRPWHQSSEWELEQFVIKNPETSRSPQRMHGEDSHRKSTPLRSEPLEDKPRAAGWLSRAVGWIRNARRRDNQSSKTPPEDGVPPIPIEEAVHLALPSQSRTIGKSNKLDEANERAKSLAARFNTALEDLTPGKRLELWPELAAAFAQANQPSEAALCWLNAMWEQGRTSPLWAWGWLKAEATQAGWNPHEADLSVWLAAPADKFRPRAVAAFAVWATLQEVVPKGFKDHITRLSAYLDAHEHNLPIRAAWLVRVALTRSAHGDVLGLARTRDRLLARLSGHGLSLANDVPSFVRAVGTDDPDRLSQVGKWLTNKRKTIHEWIGSLGFEASGIDMYAALPRLYEIEAEIPCTQAYADLMIAWGLSRLGENSEAGRLRDRAHQNLSEIDPIHGFLRAAFDFRLMEARENHPVSSFPTAVLARLDALAPNDRYRVDRFRQRSRILEPLESIDVWWGSTMQHFRGWDELRRRLIELPRLERTELNQRVKALLDRFEQNDPNERPAILLAILGVSNRVERASIEQVLDRALGMPVSSPPLFVRILERGLQAAATLGLDGKVRLFVNRFASFVEEQKGQTSPSLLAGLTGQSFRCLRKFGMKDEADNTLSKIALWLTRGLDLKELRQTRANDWPVVLRTLLHVSAGWYFCGRSTQGHRIIEETRTKDLFDGAMSLPDRTALALAYVGAIGQIPVKLAQGCYEELFARLKTISVTGWNSHFTIQPLELVDTVVRSVVSDDFTLSSAVRGWLDDDEFNVRQRIHREMKDWMEQQGV